MLRFGSATSKPPKSIINGFSAGGTLCTNNISGWYLKTILSGALTAATYKEVLAIVGSGVIDLAAVYAVDATSRTLGLKVEIDGVTIFDAVSSACTATGGNIQAIGVMTEVAVNVALQPKTFNSSLSISVKSSLTETDKVGLKVLYHTT